MPDRLPQAVEAACQAVGNDPTRMLDICLALQAQLGCVSREAMQLIAAQTGCRRVDVERVVSFYAFLSPEPRGEIVIRLSNDLPDLMHGARAVAAAMEDELGIAMGETTPDGRFTLVWTPCIGLSDQAPAALVNSVPVTELTPDKARAMLRELREHRDPRQLVKTFGDGKNASPLIAAMVRNNLRQAGPVLFAGDLDHEAALTRTLSMIPERVIEEVKASKLRGRGGAGFPTGVKWYFARQAERRRKFVICNADEGEPGTFKDRLLLTERIDMMLTGMTIAAYAVGAREGIVYLRQEYAYLQPWVKEALARRREAGLLGEAVAGKDGFDFDIRIQMGAGAYICGEETALISSCEGRPGNPSTRPPFPAQRGYLGYPTAVNNVETYCKVAWILQHGAAAFAAIGTAESAGTKLLSVSGDCTRPGVYELPFGVSLAELLEQVGGKWAKAVLVGGPSGRMVAARDFGRRIAFEDLATGGSIMIFGPHRDLLEAVLAFSEFFEEETCGYCTPCRVGCTLIRERVARIVAGRGEPADLDYLRALGAQMRQASRCGLGVSAANPVLSTLEAFPEVFAAAVRTDPDGFRPAFDLERALAPSESLVGRRSVHAAPSLPTT
ncbi:MAG: NAD(P)H-dependent oxidoreductase subunit E [Chloroflexi bacterium]|nr:NAD(P)H-dependent oxidoreductase subunit E [Chloroflexota bacterium]